MPETDVAAVLLRGLRNLRIATVVLYCVVVLGGGGLLFYTANRASQSTSALCALRSDEQRRVATATTFLTEHPHGIPGVSPASIATTIDSQTRTIKALAVLHC